MDYAFEQLGDERFQQLCQALLTACFPSIQCFPVGQPDGGRNAALYHSRIGRDDTMLLLPGIPEDDRHFSVFQVKFLRNPQAQLDPHKWLLATIEKEAPKIASLIPKGAKDYYLLTNAAGTAHLDVGSIDAVNNILSKLIPIPTSCWWRDDLNRRLESHPGIKWSYPEILSGPDVLRLIVQQGLSDHGERRTLALRTYIRAQYDRDKDIRFKQVELQNKLCDLFVDVPIQRSGVTSGPPEPGCLLVWPQPQLRVVRPARGRSS